MKPRLRYRTDRAWFSRLLRRPARKRSGSILTTPEPALGLRQRVTRHQTPGRVKSAGASHVSSSRRRLRPVSNSGIEAACRLIAYARRAARYTTRAGGRTSATHRGIGPPMQPARPATPPPSKCQRPSGPRLVVPTAPTDAWPLNAFPTDWLTGNRSNSTSRLPYLTSQPSATSLP